MFNVTNSFSWLNRFCLLMSSTEVFAPCVRNFVKIFSNGWSLSRTHTNICIVIPKQKISLTSLAHPIFKIENGLTYKCGNFSKIHYFLVFVKPFSKNTIFDRFRQQQSAEKLCYNCG